MELPRPVAMGESTGRAGKSGPSPQASKHEHSMDGGAAVGHQCKRNQPVPPPTRFSLS